MEIVIIVLLILLNGIFAMSEMSLVSSKRFKLENAKKKGSVGATKALELAENPTRFLSTVQIGITLIGILLGVYSGENLTQDVVAIIDTIEPLKPYSGSIATAVIVVFITYLSIVLGELLPKRIGMSFPETIISALAQPMYLLSVITSPFVWLLSATNNLLLTIMGLNKTAEGKVSEEEIKAIVKESAQVGEIQDIEQDIVERVFELGDRRVNSLYTHRTDLVYFNITDTWEMIAQKINAEKHSAYPIVENNNLDDVLGIALLKDLFLTTKDTSFNLRNYLKQPVYITENAFAYKVLELFKKEKMHYGIVVDEYGSTIGMVTMDDLIDALVGDVSEIEQEEYQIVQRNENSWLVDGQFSLIEFKKAFSLEIDEKMLQNYATVAGLVMHELSAIPKVGDVCQIGHLKMEIVDKDGQRIDKLLVTIDAEGQNG